MAKNVFCDNGCKYESNGYRLNNIDLKDIDVKGAYLLGDTITDTEGTWSSEIHPNLENSLLIIDVFINTANNYKSVTQVLYSISSDSVCRRRVDTPNGETTTVGEWEWFYVSDLIKSEVVNKIEVVTSYPETEEDDVLYIKIDEG